MRLDFRARVRINVILILMALVLFPPCGSHAGDLLLHPVVMREINQTVRAGDGLHVSLISRDEERIDISIRDLIHQVDRVRTVLILAKQHERPHLLKILESAREQLESAQTAFGEDRRVRLQEAFNQVVNLVRIYRVDREFGIFFCQKDKSSWVQKGVKAQNPFNPTLRSCGMRVTN